MKRIFKLVFFCSHAFAYEDKLVLNEKVGSEIIIENSKEADENSNEVASGNNRQIDNVLIINDDPNGSKEIFKKAGAHSTRDKFDTNSIDEVLRGVPGTFTNIDKSSGSVSVNIRGANGFGKINSLIDGVSQTSFASSTDGGGRSGATSSFGLAIDQAFLSKVDIQRGDFSGSSGINSLFGSAHFKTLGVSDVVSENNNFGYVGNFFIGNNGYGPDYSSILAFRRQFGDYYYGILLGYSLKNLSQDYKVGGGVRIADIDKERLEKLKKENPNFDEDDLANTDTTPFDPNFLLQNPVSKIAKFEFFNDSSSSVLTYRSQENKVGKRNIDSKVLQLNYNLELNDYLNLNLLLNNSSFSQNYDIGAKVFGKEIYKFLQSKNLSKTIDVNNKAKFEILDTETEIGLGFNFLKNIYTKNRHPYELNFFFRGDGDDGLEGEELKKYIENLVNGNIKEDDCIGLKCLKPSGSNAFQPEGWQEFRTVYLDNSFAYGIANLNLNLNFQDYKYSGKYIKSLKDIKDFNKFDKTNIDKFCKYDEDLEETVCDEKIILLNKQGKRNAFNYNVGLFLNANKYFNPFASFSKTTRMPNIKEMFFSAVGNLGVNYKLKPERAYTFQLGFNGSANNVLVNNDNLYYKFVTYNTKVKDYIHNVLRYSPNSDGRFIAFLNQTIYHENYSKPVKYKGFEAEINYENKKLYANLSYSAQKNNQPTSFTDASARIDVDSSDQDAQAQQGFGLSKIAILPDDYGYLDLGFKFPKTTFGFLTRYFGSSYRASPISSKNINLNPKPLDRGKPVNTRDNKYIRSVDQIPSQPLIFNLYGLFNPIKNLTIKTEIQNIFDRRYIDPLDSNNDSASQTFFNIDIDADNEISVLNNYARGRTFVVNINYKY